MIINDRFMISGGSEGKIVQWDFQAGQIVGVYEKFGSGVESLCENRSLNCFYVGLVNGLVKMVDERLNNNNNVCDLLVNHEDVVTKLILNDNTLISGSKDKTIKFFDIRK